MFIKQRPRSFSPLFPSLASVWYESTSNVDFDRFLAEINGRCGIDRVFKCVNPYRLSIWNKFSSRWTLIDRRYRPYSQVGDSSSTVDIDRDRSIGRLTSSRPIDGTLCSFLVNLAGKVEFLIKNIFSLTLRGMCPCGTIPPHLLKSEFHFHL